MSMRWPAAAVLLLVCGCTPPATDRRPVAITEARLADDRTLELGVASCNGEPEVTELVEDDDQVRVEVTSRSATPGTPAWTSSRSNSRRPSATAS